MRVKAAFKEHKEEKMMHMAETAEERRDAPASHLQPALKKIMIDEEKKSAYDHGKLDPCYNWQAGKRQSGMMPSR